MANKFKEYAIPISLFLILATFIIVSKITGNKIEKDFKSKVGNRVVIENDTLTILDYSILMNNFTLSNGKKVSKVFIDNQSRLIKPTK